ncbi:hypothetical protein [uncultured Empedobacter sp.]|uniref:hypothetical protein n=1 Tax=uncultured Empedobacter sp. TaxID=410844 RepID=UPI0025F2E1D2|nr:hypothetical protein [uncultured Empedobacter sp.]
MTQEEAQAIYNTYNGRAGRKPSTYNQAIQILGIEINKPETTKQIRKGNFIYKNDDVSENEKFRYVRIKQIQNLNSTNLSSDAYLLLLALQVSPNSNSLGVFKISYNELQVQTAGLTKERITKALNELIMLGEIRYYDGVVYLNNFHSNQKQHGNKDNLIGIIKQYNSLADAHKLPYLGIVDYQSMNMEQLIKEFIKIKKGIECLGVIASGRDVVIADYADVYNEEQLINIIENNIESYSQTLPVVKNNIARLLVVDETSTNERSIEPVVLVETLQQPQDEKEEITINQSVEETSTNEQTLIFQQEPQPIEQQEPQTSKIIPSSTMTDEEIDKYEEQLNDDEYEEYIHNGGANGLRKKLNESQETLQQDEQVTQVIPQEEEIKMNYSNFDKIYNQQPQQEEEKVIEKDTTDYEVNDYRTIRKVTIRQVVAWLAKATSEKYELLIDNYQNDLDFKKYINEIVSELTNRGNTYVTISFNMFCRKYNLPIPPKVVQSVVEDVTQPVTIEETQQETNEDKLTKVLNYLGIAHDNELQVDTIKAMLLAGSSEEVIKEAIQQKIVHEENEYNKVIDKQDKLDKKIEKSDIEPLYDPTTGKMSDELVSRLKNK